ncbi:hypothetical protein GW916_07880 [bacterium]|nr:hypothetical protein [bacterium]
MELKALVFMLVASGITLAARAQVMPSNTVQLAEKTSENLAESKLSQKVVCSLDLSKDWEFIQDSNRNDEKPFGKVGDKIVLTIENSDPKIEVLVKYKEEKSDEASLPEKKFEVTINNKTSGLQENYLTSKLKDFLYITQVKGLYNLPSETSQSSEGLSFDAVHVSCSVE